MLFPVSKRNSIFIGSAAQRSRDVNRDSCFIQEAVDSSGIYIPGVDLLIDDSECEPIDLISRFSRTPISSPKIVDPGSTISCALAGPLSSSHIFNQLDSNVAQRYITNLFFYFPGLWNYQLDIPINKWALLANNKFHNHKYSGKKCFPKNKISQDCFTTK